MTDRYEIDFSDDPVFETVTGLTNTTFNINNVVENRMATEGQLLDIANRINDLQNRINYCCNDIVTWKTYVRVIAENSNTVMSDWDENVVVGTTRKNNPFTVYFGLPLDTEKFYPNASMWNDNNSDRAWMHVKVNITGRASLSESFLISDAMNMDIDSINGVTPEGRKRVGFARNRLSNAGYSFFPTYSSNPNNPGNNSVTMNIPVYTTTPAAESEIENNPFPILSSDNKYRVYLDGSTVKIDVITKSHFAENDYVASFFIQYVLREGMTL